MKRWLARALCTSLAALCMLALPPRAEAQERERRPRVRSEQRGERPETRRGKRVRTVEREERVRARRARRAQARERARAAEATSTATGGAGEAARTAAAQADAEIVREGDTRVKVMTFSGLDIEGRLRSPQLVYFAERVRAELARPRLSHRSFLPELSRSAAREPQR